MQTLKIRIPKLVDAPDLLTFELANRLYFERWVNARGDDFYSLESVRNTIEAAERERRNDLSHQYLIIVGTEIAGRVNLKSVARPYFNKAELGYRIGERFSGKGNASKAVDLVLQEAFGTLGLWRIEATARPDNPGSVRVLEQNGFKVYGRSQKCYQLHGTWYDLLHFEQHNSSLHREEDID